MNRSNEMTTVWEDIAEDVRRQMDVVREGVRISRERRGLVVSAPHPDDLAVDRFTKAMKDKLARSRAKGYGGWEDPDKCTIELLSQLLCRYVDKGDPVDVGNFAMMIHQRGGRIF
jgi:hypothetical protein